MLIYAVLPHFDSCNFLFTHLSEEGSGPKYCCSPNLFSYLFFFVMRPLCFLQKRSIPFDQCIMSFMADIEPFGICGQNTHACCLGACISDKRDSTIHLLVYLTTTSIAWPMLSANIISEVNTLLKGTAVVSFSHDMPAYVTISVKVLTE